MKIYQLEIRKVTSLAPDATVFQASQALLSDEVGVLAITNNGKLIASLSEREIVMFCAGDLGDPRKVSVAEISNHNPPICHEGTHLEVALEMMARLRQCWLLIADEHARVIGAVTADALIAMLRRTIPEDADKPVLGSVTRVRGGDPPI